MYTFTTGNDQYTHESRRVATSQQLFELSLFKYSAAAAVALVIQLIERKLERRLIINLGA